MACTLIGATRVYALEERNNANNLFLHEREELAYPAARATEWLNEHIAEVLETTQINDLRAFQTPGRRRAPLQQVAAARIPARNISPTPEPEAGESLTVDESLPVQPAINEEPNAESETESHHDKHHDHDEDKIPQPEILEPQITADHPDADERVDDEDIDDEHIHNEDVAEEHVAAEDTVEEQLVQPEPEMDLDNFDDAQGPSTVRLYTDSEIGSPSTHATPDVPVRHASFSFASLPPRDVPQTIQTTRQQSLGLDSDATEDEHIYIRAPELVAHEERMQAYASSPQAPSAVADIDEDAERYAASPPTVTAIAEPPVPQPIETPVVAGPSTRQTRSKTRVSLEETRRIETLRQSLATPTGEAPSTVGPTQPTDTTTQEENLAGQAPVTARVSHNEQAVALVSEEDNTAEEGQETEEPVHEAMTQPQNPDESTAPDNAADRSRLRAPRNLGRPVRRTNTTSTTATTTTTTRMSTTQHIRIRSLAQSRPVNNAPVAPHRTNTTQTRNVRPKPPTQFVQPPARPQPPPPRSFLLAQRKKEEDDRAAARDTALKKQLQERRDNKIEGLKNKKREEQETIDREARRKSDENARKHIRELDELPTKLANFETRQEREEAAAAEKKRQNREAIIQRQANLPQSRLYGSSSIRPLTTIALNQPARPASRLEMHDDESEDEPTPIHVPQPRSVQEPEISQLTRAAPVQSAQRQPQRPPTRQENNPSNPSNNLHRAPIRGSNIQRAQPTQTVSQATTASLANFPAPPNRGVAPDMRQYATQRPPMANELPPQPQRAQPPQGLSQNAAGGNSIRPPPQSVRSMRLIQTIKESSPIDSNISLPEIHTDSSEDSDRASLASWVSPRRIFQTLENQETYDTDRIFGRIKRVAIDDVFGTMPPEKRQRLAMRTSSANWIRTGDALTEVEVIEDRAGREAIRNAGGWIYGISDVHKHDINSIRKA